MIKIVNGDLLKATENIIGHQVNARGFMGSGVALQIKDQYPHVFANYKLECMASKESKELLGQCQLVGCHDKTVANLFGQDGFGRDKQHTEVDKLEQALILLRDYAEQNCLSVALPYRIGSDRGGASWEEVYSIIDNAFDNYEVTLYKWNG